MNRTERRRAGRQGKAIPSEPMRQYKQSEIDAIEERARREGCRFAVEMMLGFPIMVLRDKYGFGRKRLEQFVDHVTELYDSFERGYITLEDLRDTIHAETGVTIELN